jgi:hypothetical protein
MSVWNVHPACPADVRVKIKRAVRALPTGYLNPLYNGEDFESPDVTDRPYCQCQACQDLALYMDTLPVEVSDSPACNLLSLEHPTTSCHSAYDLFLWLYIRVSAITSSLLVVVCSLCDT